MPANDDSRRQIWVAIIGAIAAIIVGFLGYLGATGGFGSTNTGYTGFVRSETGQRVAKARVSITEDQNVPQVLRTDSEGVFHTLISKKTQNILLEVDADGYSPYSRETRPSGTGPEEILLRPKIPTPASNPPAPTNSGPAVPPSGTPQPSAPPNSAVADSQARDTAFVAAHYARLGFQIGKSLPGDSITNPRFDYSKAGEVRVQVDYTLDAGHDQLVMISGQLWPAQGEPNSITSGYKPAVAHQAAGQPRLRFSRPNHDRNGQKG